MRPEFAEIRRFLFILEYVEFVFPLFFAVSLLLSCGWNDFTEMRKFVYLRSNFIHFLDVLNPPEAGTYSLTASCTNNSKSHFCVPNLSQRPHSRHLILNISPHQSNNCRRSFLSRKSRSSPSPPTMRHYLLLPQTIFLSHLEPSFGCVGNSRYLSVPLGTSRYLSVPLASAIPRLPCNITFYQL